MIINNEINNCSTTKDKSYSLIVNYLPQSIKENDLNEIFSKIGKLKSCKLMQDKQTGYSYGFAFIEYVKGEEDGKLACEKLNGFKIDHKTIRVTPARPQSNETRNTKLYIKGFPKEFNEKNFQDLFSPFGQIIQCRILKDKSIAFIIMSTRSQAQTAKDHLHGLQISPSYTLYVKFNENDSRKHQITYPNLNLYQYPIVLDQYYLSCPVKVDVIYVYGLTQSVTQTELFNLFSQYGNVLRVDIIMDRNTGLSKGYAFIFMEEYTGALTAIEQLNNSLFHGRYLQVRFKNSSNNNNQINY
jgi:RNA recognition motif-containing protein